MVEDDDDIIEGYQSTPPLSEGQLTDLKEYLQKWRETYSLLDEIMKKNEGEEKGQLERTASQQILQTPSDKIPPPSVVSTSKQHVPKRPNSHVHPYTTTAPSIAPTIPAGYVNIVDKLMSSRGNLLRENAEEIAGKIIDRLLKKYPRSDVLVDLGANNYPRYVVPRKKHDEFNQIVRRDGTLRRWMTDR